MAGSIRALRALEHRAPVPRAVLSQLFYGWANEDFAAEPEFLAAIVDAARRTRGPILECGCGLSTLVLGVEADKRGLKVYSLEHDSHWARLTRRALKRQGIGCVTVIVAQLRNYGAFMWYDPPRSELPSDFSLVVCDGPPHTTQGGRYGLLPVLYAHLEAGGEILLDDVARDEDRRILDRWISEFGVHSTIEGVEKPFARLRLPPSFKELKPATESGGSSS
jgi:predicted O-methyltransferase YrrM